MERLLYHQFADEKAFKDAFALFVSNFRAACRLTRAEIEFFGGPEMVVSTDFERSKFWLTDSFGREVLISDDAHVAEQQSFKCVLHSPIATATQTLWDREQQSYGAQASCLYRIPSRKELGEELALDEPAITKLCQAEGLNWLPRSSVRKKRIRGKLLRHAA
jgi:hypothetical protein